MPDVRASAAHVRAAAASTLGKVQDTGSVPRIIELVEDRAPVNAQDGNENTVALAAIEGLGYLRDPRAVAPIMAVMHVPNQEYSRPYVALAALARIGDPRAVHAILPFAGEEWHEGAGTNFRKYGGESAMRQLGESAEPELRAAFTDPDVAYWRPRGWSPSRCTDSQGAHWRCVGTSSSFCPWMGVHHASPGNWTRGRTTRWC